MSGACAQIKSRQQDVSCSVCRPHAAFFNFTVSRSALLFSEHTSVRTLSHTPGDRTLEHFDGGRGYRASDRRWSHARLPLHARQLREN